MLPFLFIAVFQNLPRGARTPYAAQTVCVDFHSSPGDGAFASLPQNENSYITNLAPLRSAPGICRMVVWGFPIINNLQNFRYIHYYT